MFEQVVAELPVRAHYQKLAADLERGADKPSATPQLRFPALVARAIALKCDLRQRLVKAYHADDRGALAAMADDVKQAHAAVDALYRHHRDLWLAQNKPFGWEVLEHRYGGLLARLDSLAYRLEHGDGQRAGLAELAETLRMIPRAPDDALVRAHSRLTSPSAIRG